MPNIVNFTLLDAGYFVFLENIPELLLSWDAVKFSKQFDPFRSCFEDFLGENWNSVQSWLFFTTGARLFWVSTQCLMKSKIFQSGLWGRHYSQLCVYWSWLTLSLFIWPWMVSSYLCANQFLTHWQSGPSADLGIPSLSDELWLLWVPRLSALSPLLMECPRAGNSQIWKLGKS